MHVIVRVLHVLAQYRAFRTTLVELGRQSDEQLHGLGIDRADVARIAYERAERLPSSAGCSGHAAPTWPPTMAAVAR
jgi:uncharacterized protein YjiS (DUF1127 family)